MLTLMLMLTLTLTLMQTTMWMSVRTRVVAAVVCSGAVTSRFLPMLAGGHRLLSTAICPGWRV
jgi:hypothetical protein